MHKDMTLLGKHFAGLIEGQLAQILDLVAHAAGFQTNLLGVQPILMAVFTGLMCGELETTITHLTVTIHTSASVIDNVLVVAKGEFVAVFFITANQQNNRHQADGCRLKH